MQKHVLDRQLRAATASKAAIPPRRRQPTSRPLRRQPARPQVPAKQQQSARQQRPARQQPPAEPPAKQKRG